MLAAIFGFDDVHGIGVSEVVDVEEVIMLSFSHEVKGVVPIGLVPLTFINDLSSVSIENGIFSIFQSKRILEPLPETIEEVGSNFCSNLEVVITEDDLL